jgi:putative transposase
VNTQKRNHLKYSIIQELSSHYPVSLLCIIAGVSRSGYYKWVYRQQKPSLRQVENNQIKQKIMECHKKMNGIYGYYRVKTWLYRVYGIVVNHKRVYRLMKLLGIQAKIRRKKRYFGEKGSRILSDNILNREFQAQCPNQKWVTDITYLLFNNQRLYLSVIYDLFNREVVAYQISERNDIKLVLNTVKKAIKKRDVHGTLLHSDRGFQYTSRQYNKLIQRYNIISSMSRKGNCLDNACVENFFGHIKSELLYLHHFETKESVIQAVKRYIHFYNTERFQKKLHNLSPIEYRTQISA